MGVRRLQTRLRENQDAYQTGALESQWHAWQDHHSIKWEETTVMTRADTLDNKLLLKEDIHT